MGRNSLEKERAWGEKNEKADKADKEEEKGKKN